MKTIQAPENRQKTVMVVDDDVQILSLVSDILADGNYNVLTASGGAAAIEQAREYALPIDLLLSDFEMPGMTGVDLAIKMTADRPALKVLLMSGFQAGMLVLNEGWHFLPKPFMGSQLRTLISGLIPHKAAK